MPIFEYLCKSCGKSFEKLVPKATDKVYPCPECGSEETEKKLSVFSPQMNADKHSCPSASTCESMGAPCCGAGKCPMQ